MTTDTITNSLGIDDEDGIDLIEDVEAAFQVRFLDSEIENCVTVDDVYELVVKHLPAADRQSGQCANVFCFNLLRKKLQPLFPDVQFRPATPIDELDSVAVRKIYGMISDNDLRPPVGILSGFGVAALLMAFAGPLVAWFLAAPWWLIILSPLLGILFYRISPIHMPEGIETFGDLVKTTANQNIALFAEKGARLGPDEAWDALLSILINYTALPMQEITKDKRLLRV